MGEATAADKVQDEMTFAALTSAWSNRDSIFSSMWENKDVVANNGSSV